RSLVRGGSLRGLISASRRHGDDGTGADDQRGVVGCRRVLVVPGSGPVWPSSATGDIGCDDVGDGHGFCRGHAIAPPTADRHDRWGPGAGRMTGAQAALLAMIVLPAAVGAGLVLTRTRRFAVSIALVTAGLTTGLAFG